VNVGPPTCLIKMSDVESLQKLLEHRTAACTISSRFKGARMRPTRIA
jgi:hypothetical protein